MGERTDVPVQGNAKTLPPSSGHIFRNQQGHKQPFRISVPNGDYGKTLCEYWNSAKKGYKERFKRGEPELSTGFKWLDEWTDGLHKGEVWCISGRPAVGKTTFAMNIARNISDKNKSVLFISLEMTGEQIVSRMFCEMMGYDFQLLRTGEWGTDFNPKDKTFMDFINAVDFEIVEKGYRYKEILDIIETRYSDKKPDLIMLDFIQLIDKEGLDDRLALDEFMRKITELAKTLNLAVIIISQLRRLPSGADINREPEISDNRGSGMIEQLAHVVVIIYKVIEKSVLGQNEKIFLKVAKNRHGRTGERELQFTGSQYKFREMPYEMQKNVKEIY